jgi:hypothetical protein
MLLNELLVVGPIVGGLAAHAFWKRNEPGFYQVLNTVLAAFLGLSATLYLQTRFNATEALLQSLRAVGLALATLATSIAVYRNSPWHPLAAFPGPILARTTQCWWFYHTYRSKPRYLLQALHKKHGDIIRIAPNELSVANVDAMMPIHGVYGWPKCTSFEKGLLTNVPDPSKASLQTQIHLKPHTLRRKQGWDRAFSGSSLRNYEFAVWKCAQQCFYRIAEQKGPVNFSHWIGGFVYEVMGAVAFGRGFDILKTGRDDHGVIQALIDAHFAHGLCDSMLWVKPLMELLPTNKAFKTMLQFSAEQFDIRYKKGDDPNMKDAFSYLIADHGKGIPPLSYEILIREAMLVGPLNLPRPR